MRFLVASELRLFVREPASLVFAFGFPTLMMLVLGGVFGSDPAPEYGGVTPAAYYVADYLVVPLAVLAFVTLPTHVATYRATGVYRRYVARGCRCRPS